MATHISGSAIAEGERPKSRALGLLFLIVVAVILGILLASQVVNRWLTFEVEEGPDGNSAALLSPLGKFSFRGNRSLLLSVYPNSTPKEQASLDWTDGPETSAKGRRQLIVLTFQSAASLEQISSWYKKELGSGFSQSKSWTTMGNEEVSTWIRRVESHSQPEAISFRQELPHRTRGVLLLSGRGVGQGSEIKLYDYMESPG